MKSALESKESSRSASLPVSVVVCVKNGEATIAECLESIQDNHPAEIIIMDGNSTDRTREIAQRYTDKIYSLEEGLGYRFQFGTEQATKDYVAYVDSDVVVPSGTLEVMLGELTATRYVGIHAQIQAISTSDYWERARQQDLHITYNHPGKPLRSISTMTALWRRDIILKYRFDPFFTIGAADADIFYRVTADGHKLGCSQAFIYHRHRATLGSLIRQGYWHGQSWARFLWKHKSLWNMSYLVRPSGPVRLAKCLLNGKPQFIPYVFVYDVSGWVGRVIEFARLLWRRLLREEGY